MLAFSNIGTLCGDPCDTCLGEIDRSIGVYRWKPCGVKLSTAYGTDITFDGAAAVSMLSYVMDDATVSALCGAGYGYGGGCDRRFCRVNYVRSNDVGIPVWSRATNLDFDIAMAFDNASLYGLCDSDYTALNYDRPQVSCGGANLPALVRTYTANDGWLGKTRSFDGIVRSCILETITNPTLALEVAKRQTTICGVSRWMPTHIRAQTNYTYTMAVRSRFVGNVVDTVTRQDYNWFNLFGNFNCTAFPNGIFGPGSYTYLNRGAIRAPLGTAGDMDITTLSWVVGASRNPNTATTTSTNTSHNGDSCEDASFPTISNPSSDPAIATKAQLASQYKTIGYSELVSGFGPWQSLVPGRQQLQGGLSERPWQQGWDSAALADQLAIAQSSGQAAFVQCQNSGFISNNGSYAQVLRSGSFGGVVFPVTNIGSFGSRTPLVVELDKCNASEADCNFATCGPSIFSEAS
jgi:hypothetical protein